MAVGFGGGLGSILRYLVGVGCWRLFSGVHFPVATLIVNVLGCLMYGLVVSSLRGEAVLMQLFLLTGIMGGFTTFSAFGYETVMLVKSDYIGWAILNVVLSVVLGFGVIWYTAKSVNFYQ